MFSFTCNELHVQWWNFHLALHHNNHSKSNHSIPYFDDKTHRFWHSNIDIFESLIDVTLNGEQFLPVRRLFSLLVRSFSEIRSANRRQSDRSDPIQARNRSEKWATLLLASISDNQCLTDSIEALSDDKQPKYIRKVYNYYKSCLNEGMAQSLQSMTL